MIFKKLTLSLILAILISPLIATFFGLEVGKPVKKNTIAMPAFEKLSFTDIKMEYFSELGQWFSANNSFEGFYLRLWNQVRWSLFGVSDEIVAGVDGWEVDKKSVFEQLPETDKVSSGTLKDTILLIKKFQNYLNKKNIEFVIVIIPFKSTIYPEKYLNSNLPIRGITGLRKYQTAFKKNEITHIDAEEILLKHKEESVYYKTDLHFNTLGAHYVSKELISYLYKKFNLVQPNIPMSAISLTEFNGGSANIAMPLLFELNEMVPVITAPNNLIKESLVIKDGQEAVERYKSTLNNVSLLPPSIMFGNSYMLLYPTVGYNNYFSKSTPILDYKFFSQALDYIEDDTKIVILNIYETQLLFHLPHNNQYNYWDPRIYDLPLPEGFTYQE